MQELCWFDFVKIGVNASQLCMQLEQVQKVNFKNPVEQDSNPWLLQYHLSALTKAKVVRVTLHNGRIFFFLLFGRCQHPSTRRSVSEEVNLPLAGYLILWVRSEHSQSKDEWSSLIPQTPLKFPQMICEIRKEEKRRHSISCCWFALVSEWKQCMHSL